MTSYKTQKRLRTAEEARADLMEAQFMGGVILSALVAAIYGAVQLFRRGVELGAWPSTYLPLLGGLAAIVAVPVYVRAVKAQKGRSWGVAAGSFGAVIPYLFSLYVMGFLGAWAAYRAFAAHPLAWSHALTGAFWLFVGWRMLFMLRRLRAHLSQTARRAAMSARPDPLPVSSVDPARRAKPRADPARPREPA